MSFETFLKDLLYVVILAIAPVITTYVAKFLTAKRDLTDTANLTNWQKWLLENILKAIQDAVVATNQTFVDDLKKSGQWNDATKAQAFEKTKAAVLATLTVDAKDLIVELYQNVDTWLDTMIESIVSQVKGG